MALLVVGGVVVGGVVLGGAAFAVGYATTDVPEPTALGQAATTTVYYADGTTPLGTFAEVNRTPVDRADIPDVMREAIIAAEDRSFYENRGVSPSGIVRAFVSNVTGNATQGGSTITQQYVKNYYTGDDTRSLERKVREAFIALKVDQELDKDQILTDYLNTIYYGRGAYGVQEAAQAYFGVDVGELDTAQAALLAGIVPSPSAYDPAVDAAAAQDRWDYVVDGMVATGALTQAERDALAFPETIEPQEEQTYAGPTGYLLQAVRDELTSRGGFTEDELDAGGLSITTTFDAGMQQAAVDAMDDEDAFPSEDRPDDVLAGLVSIDPADGAVRAMYGGADYLERQANAATFDTMQAGSIFKPFTLVAALEDGVSLRTRLDGRSGQYFDGYTSDGVTPKEVNNFDDEDEGYQNLVEATTTSTNTVYVPLNLAVGPDRTQDVAIRAGLPEDTVGLGDNAGNVLGTASPHVLDMARAYSTFAAQGVRTTPHVVAEVTQDGELEYRGQTDGERVFAEDVMADTTYALEQVVEDGSVSRTIDLDRPAAGKTGTSESARSAWFAGYTPQLATVVSVFTTKPDSEGGMDRWDDGSTGVVTGSSYPTRIWQEYMEVATDGMPVEDFPERADVGTRGLPSSTSSSSRDDEDDDAGPSRSSRSSSDEGDQDDDAPAVVQRDPGPTRAPEPTADPEPTQEPEVTAEPEPEPTPEATGEPVAPTRTADPDPDPDPEPEPTVPPETSGPTTEPGPRPTSTSRALGEPVRPEPGQPPVEPGTSTDG
ncbi:transglycosylase domain-containing protein [Pseudokineococcus basanitobsidens]|uniref:Transglycosylase domain-containing protein n=1 Tax=Pseudokineococcus basanitobsidens TaxID=1926649 RepID=A0ABU8RL09_9ACTN